MSEQPSVYVGDDGAVYQRMRNINPLPGKGNAVVYEKVMSPEMLAFIKSLIREAINQAFDEYIDLRRDRAITELRDIQDQETARLAEATLQQQKLIVQAQALLEQSNRENSCFVLYF